MTLIEAIQKANNGKTFGLKCDQIGEILVSQEGLKIINQHPHKVERFFTGLYDRKNEWDLSREEGGNKDFFYLQEDHLRPHVKEKQIYLGRGSEGAAFQMPNLDLVLKFYDQEGSGIDLFNSLSDVPQSTVFRTPQPYFASDNLLAQEDFTKFQNYLDFVKANPNEKSRILKYLEKLIKEDPIEVDIAFEFASEEELKLFEETKEVFGKIPSSVFIVKFDSTQRAASKRYKLATVDIR